MTDTEIEAKIDRMVKRNTKGVKNTSKALFGLSGATYVIIGYIVLVCAQAFGIGFFLYEWGASGMEIGAAAWSAFKAWLVWMGVGFMGLLYGFKQM